MYLILFFGKFSVHHVHCKVPGMLFPYTLEGL